MVHIFDCKKMDTFVVQASLALVVDRRLLGLAWHLSRHGWWAGGSLTWHSRRHHRWRACSSLARHWSWHSWWAGGPLARHLWGHHWHHGWAGTSLTWHLSWHRHWHWHDHGLLLISFLAFIIFTWFGCGLTSL